MHLRLVCVADVSKSQVPEEVEAQAEHDGDDTVCVVDVSESQVPEEVEAQAVRDGDDTVSPVSFMLLTVFVD